MIFSDAYSGFGAHDSITHNTEANEANEYLNSVVIPKFASYLDQAAPAHLAFDKLVLRCKLAGVNLELLGAVRTAVKSAEAKSLVLHEIVRIPPACNGNTLAVSASS